MSTLLDSWNPKWDGAQEGVSDLLPKMVPLTELESSLTCC